MEFKKISKTIGIIRRIPLPFKMKKYKETDLNRHIILLKGNKPKTINRLKLSSENPNKENLKFIEDKNQNIILKRNKTIENKIIPKKNDLIPIISHNSKKPAKNNEENSSGKLYSSVCDINKKNKKEFLKEKKYENIPIVAHQSELPSMSFEEIYSGKINSNIQTSMTKYNKKFDEIPIITHDSEKPSICFEESFGGKMNSNIATTKTNYGNKIKRFDEIPIIVHKSEKPSSSFEEVNSGKIKSFLHYSLTNVKKMNHSDKNKYKNKNKKYIDIPIIAHDSEKPSITFEEITCIHKKNIKYNTIINYKESNKFKYKEIPIIAHNSEKPSKIFEESNAGMPWFYVINFKF